MAIVLMCVYDAMSTSTRRQPPIECRDVNGATEAAPQACKSE